VANHDPRKAQQPLSETDDDELREQIEELQATVRALVASKPAGGLDESTLERILSKVALVSAEAQERAMNPSNKTHPNISVFSYPEGDRARPRAFKCPMFWAGYDLGLDTTSAVEIELLNLAEPGIYRFRRTDGTQDTLTVDGIRKQDGSYDRLLFTFQTKEGKETLPSMVSMLQQAFKVATPEQAELERMRAELDALRGKQTVAA